MPSLKNTHKLPKPAWSGFDQQLVHKYLEFTRVAQRTTRRLQHAELSSTLVACERDKEHNMGRMNSHKEAMSSLKENLAAAKAQLLDLSSNSTIDEALRAIEELPFVIGLRPDSRGYLVVFCRLFTTDHDAEDIIIGDRHIGDFEITLRVTEGTYLGYSNSRYDVIPITLVKRGSGIHRWPFHEDTTNNETSFGRLNLHGIDFKQPLSNLQPVDLIEQIANRLVVESGFVDPTPKEEVAEPLWSGTTPNLRDVLRRTLDQAVNTRARAQILSLTSEIERYHRIVRSAIDRLSSLNPEISRLRAELQEATRLLEEEVEFDEEAAKQDLRFMTSLPGVMGVKFNDNGIPVFHLRTYLELEGSTSIYDMGDFELTLLETSGDGVVKVRKTRSPTLGSSHLYFQAAGWFCFGERATELHATFRKGEFGAFLHLALNSMNSVNEGDRERVDSYYSTFPRTEVWMPNVRTRPRRRRHMMEAMAGFVL